MGSHTLTSHTLASSQSVGSHALTSHTLASSPVSPVRIPGSRTNGRRKKYRLSRLPKLHGYKLSAAARLLLAPPTFLKMPPLLHCHPQGLTTFFSDLFYPLQSSKVKQMLYIMHKIAGGKKSGALKFSCLGLKTRSSIYSFFGSQFSHHQNGDKNNIVFIGLIGWL